MHLWVPELAAAKGGIQTFSHFCHAALLRLARDWAVTTLEKHGLADRPAPNTVRGFGRVPAWMRTPVFALALFRAAQRTRPALVLSTHVNFLPVARWLKRSRGVRYVGVAHGVEVWGNLRPSVRQAMLEADAMWSVSRHTRDRLCAEQGVPAGRSAVLPDTFEEERFTPGPRPAELAAHLRLPPDAKVIFSVGRLAAAERYKGFDRVIAALPRIRQAVPQVHYVIAGSGDDRLRLEALARSAGVADRVVFAGFVPPEELCAHYRLCDVFAMPSTGEGFGIVYLEAMACGRPVLAGNRDGSTEPLRDGELGALVDPENAEQLAGTLVQILERRLVHPLMFEPERLRERVVREFGFNQFCRTLAGHLRPLLPPEMTLAE